jgi:hypothetical protein
VQKKQLDIKKINHRLHRFTQRGWHPQPIIAAGIRICRSKNFGMKTRFCNIVIQIIKTGYKKICVICVICGFFFFLLVSVFTDFNRYAAISPGNTAEAGIAGDIHRGGTGLTSFEVIHLTITKVSNG